MKVRFQADADFDRRIAHATLRRETGIDLQLAAAARDGVGWRGVPDDRVLAEAAREGRILLSHDHRTMPRHFATLAYRAQSKRRWKIAPKAWVLVGGQEV